MTGHTVRNDVAMTGEISLRGLVLPVGGIKEKTIAAHRAGIRTVLLPARNRKDLEDIPESVRKELRVRVARPGRGCHGTSVQRTAETRAARSNRHLSQGECVVYRRLEKRVGTKRPPFFDSGRTRLASVR